ncbi:MAG: carboxypeptidase M32 [Planctomycetia bacterium]|jgi:carboxypeptidase Taq
MDLQQKYEAVRQHVIETGYLRATIGLLGWDELTGMPAANAPYRAEQTTLLSGMLHERSVDPHYGEQLAELAESKLLDDPTSDTAITILRLKRNYDKSVKLPKRLVEDLTRAAVLGQSQWIKSRADSDFASFAPCLKKIVELKKEQADVMGHDDSIYDPLLDDFEPETKTADVRQVLEGLREALVPLVAEITQCGRQADTSILTRSYPVDRQKKLVREVAALIGFNFDRGMLAETTHPFCTDLGPDDCRINTRYMENFLPGGLFGTIHEAGHGIYEQGLRSDVYGLPLASYASLGIHESQSRMWENLVGRSHSFWQHLFPKVQAYFPESLGDVTLDDFYWAVNAVRPSLIRVEADEATYNLHILVRFELEIDLMEGRLGVDDLPEAWNQKYQDYLGITPPDAASGVLQDVHWSGAMIGYFSTYTLGNLYAAQLFEQAEKEIGPLADHFAQGQFGPLKTWLNEKVHSQGQRYWAAELSERITGRPLSHEPFIRYLREKLSPLYRI